MVRISAMSSNVWWLAPSSPTVIPECVAQTLTLRLEAPIEFLITSKALPVANMANVLAQTIFPTAARPAAAPYMFCSAIPILKNLSGNSFANNKVFVEPERSASITTSLSLFFPISTSFLP